MYEDANSIRFRKVTKLVGRNKNGKTFSKWKTDLSYRIIIKPSGVLQADVKQGKSFKTVTYNFQKTKAIRQEFGEQFDTIVQAFLTKHGRSPDLFEAVSPLMHYVFKQGLYPFGHKAMQESEPRKIVEGLFGKTRFRKDLAKAVFASKMDVSTLMTARAFRGLVPTDYVIKLLQDQRVYIVHERFLRKFLLKLNDQQRLAMCKIFINQGGNIRSRHLILDIVRMASMLEKPLDLKFKSDVGEIHNAYDMALRDQEHGDKEITLSKRAKEISKAPYKLVNMVPASSTSQVRHWGADMGHCIGSYAEQAYVGRCVLTGIYRDGKLIGNAMFSSASKEEVECIQIFGKYNHYLPDEIQHDIIEALPNVSFKRAHGITVGEKDVDDLIMW